MADKVMKPRKITPNQAIRKNCLSCSGFQPGEVTKCTVLDCDFWPKRFGVSPEVAAKRGKQTNPYELSGKKYSYPDGSDTYKEIDIPLWWELPLREIMKRYGLRSTDAS